MAERKFQDLTIKNNFMFGAVMAEPKNCKGIIELVLGIEVDHVEVSKEKSMVYHPEYKGVRLDVYVKDENNTRYNIEMQVAKKPALGRRTRYYQSQMDMELLLSGQEYKELPNSYVIFICDFDPFGKRKYCYTFQPKCKEDPEVDLEDGRCCVFLSTYGENEDEVPRELVNFLKFVKANQEESQKDFQDYFVKQLQDSIRWIKSSREMEERFMIFEEMMKDEREAGKQEGRREGKQETQQNTAFNMHQKGYPDEAIAEVLEVDVETVLEWISESESATK